MGVNRHQPTCHERSEKGVGTRFIASHGAGNPVWGTGRRAWGALTLGSHVAPVPRPWDAINRVPTTSRLRLSVLRLMRITADLSAPSSFATPSRLVDCLQTIQTP